MMYYENKFKKKNIHDGIFYVLALWWIVLKILSSFNALQNVVNHIFYKNYPSIRIWIPFLIAAVD